METNVIKENVFTFNKDEICAEDCLNKTLWLFKLAYDFDMSSLPPAIPLSCFTKTDNSKDLTGVIFVPSKDRKELEKFTLSGEMTIDVSMSLNLGSSEEQAPEESKTNEQIEKEKKAKHKRHKNTCDMEDVTKAPKKSISMYKF